MKDQEKKNLHPQDPDANQETSAVNVAAKPDETASEVRDDSNKPLPDVPAADQKPSGKPNHIDRRNRSLKRISVVSTVVFLIVVLLFNIGFDRLLGSKTKWDWTPGSLYSIGETSIQTLNEMNKKVEIIGLFNKETPSSSTYHFIEPLLEDYVRQSGGKVTVSYVNPNVDQSVYAKIDPNNVYKNPVDQFAIYSPDTGKTKLLSNSDMEDIQYDQQTYQAYLRGYKAEEAITGAIRYVTAEKTPVVYFTTGHDETDSMTAMTIPVSLMRNNNYDVKNLETFDLKEIPEDCAVLVIHAPKKDFGTGEVEAIGNYLRQGGGLLFIAGFTNAQFPTLNRMLMDHNLEIGNDRVLETNTSYRLTNNDPYNIRALSPLSPVNQSFADDIGYTLLTQARVMHELKNTKEWITVSPVLTTSKDGQLEIGGDSANLSAKGTQYVALASENKGFIEGKLVTKPARVVLYGASTMFDDTTIAPFMGQIRNLELFYYSIGWLANQEDSQLYIAPKRPPSNLVTAGSASVNTFMSVFAIVIVPLLLLLVALIVYRRRKHL